MIAFEFINFLNILFFNVIIAYAPILGLKIGLVKLS